MMYMFSLLWKGSLALSEVADAPTYRYECEMHVLSYRLQASKLLRHCHVSTIALVFGTCRCSAEHWPVSLRLTDILAGI